MFRIVSVIVTLSLLVFSCSDEYQFSDKFGYSPETILPGSEITIHYNTDSTILAGKDDIGCVAYLLNNKLINTIDVPLRSEGNILTGKLKTDENTLGVLIKFKANEQLDNNEKKYARSEATQQIFLYFDV